MKLWNENRSGFPESHHAVRCVLCMKSIQLRRRKYIQGIVLQSTSNACIMMAWSCLHLIIQTLTSSAQNQIKSLHYYASVQILKMIKLLKIHKKLLFCFVKVRIDNTILISSPFLLNIYLSNILVCWCCDWNSSSPPCVCLVLAGMQNQHWPVYLFIQCLCVNTRDHTRVTHSVTHWSTLFYPTLPSLTHSLTELSSLSSTSCSLHLSVVHPRPPVLPHSLI